MTYAVRRKSYAKKTASICKCNHGAIAHYTNDGHCIYPDCGCLEFKTKGRPEFTGERGACNYKHAHNSKAEIAECFQLHCMLLAKEIKSFTAEQSEELLGPSGTVLRKYRVDFRIEHNDGRVEFREVKGAHLHNYGEWPLKWDLLQDKHRGDPKYFFTLVVI